MPRYITLLVPVAVAVVINSLPAQSIHTSAESIIDQLNAVPVEFAADAAFRLIDAGRIASPKRRVQILEDIFARAHEARFAFAKRYTGPNLDDRATRLDGAFRARLDGVAIRARVVRAMLSIDRKRAMEMFDTIDMSVLPDTDCADPMSLDVSEYYRTLAIVAPRGLEPYVSSLVHYAQLAPFASLIRNQSITRADRQQLAIVYSYRLLTARGGSREFLAAELDARLRTEIGALAAKLRDDGGSANELIRNYRAFLERNLKAPRCDDSPPASVANRLAASVEFFNEHLSTLAAADLPKIEASLARPETTRPGARFELIPPPTQFTGLLGRLLQEPKAEGWEQDAETFLRRLGEWKIENECKVCAFHARALLYSVLIDVLPDGALRMRAVQSYLSFLEADATYSESPIEWLADFDLLLRLTRSPSDKAREQMDEMKRRGIRGGFTPAASGADILGEMLKSRNPAVVLYANLEALTPKPFELGFELPKQ